MPQFACQLPRSQSLKPCHYPGIGSFVLADGAVNRKNWDGREGPNVATWPTLTHACPPKGLSAFSGDCRLKAACTIKQYAQYCAPNGVAVQNCSFFKTS